MRLRLADHREAHIRMRQDVAGCLDGVLDHARWRVDTHDSGAQIRHLPREVCLFTRVISPLRRQHGEHNVVDVVVVQPLDLPQDALFFEA